MTVQLSIPFTDPANFVFNTNELEVTPTGARLVLNDLANQHFIQDFANDTGFTYDSLLAEFTGGQIQQIDQRPANSILGATYTNSFDLNWAANGFVSLSALIFGSPTLSGGEIVCAGSDGVCYSDSLIGALSGNWVAKFEYRPNYTTSPPTNVNIFAVSQATGGVDDVVIFNSPSGNNLRITANGLSAVTFGTWTPVAGQKYKFEVHCISNVVSVYVDDVQIGTGKTLSPGQGTSSDFVHLGAYSVVYNVAQGSFDNFILYSTAPQTSVYTVPERAYLGSLVELPQFNYSGLGNVQSFDSVTEIAAGSGRWILNGLYWDGGAWVVSNDTYAQANDIATINTNLSTLPVSDTLDVKLVFEDTNTQSSVSNFDMEYTGEAYLTTGPLMYVNAQIAHQDIISFIETATKLGNDDIKWILSKGNDFYWFDGIAWVLSNLTAAESNTVADVQANLSTFNNGQNLITSFGLFFISDDGSTTPVITLLEVSYDFYGGDITAPNEAIVYGYVYDEQGEPVENSTVTITANKVTAVYKEDLVVCFDTIVLTTDQDGYWDTSLIETENMDAKYVFTFECNGVVNEYIRVVPNVANINFSALKENF